ncbi:MAG: hypothetical protein RLZZ253_1634 [Verrucomicrobiota bacterium]|jgi:glutamine amidotransferase
MIALLNYGSGNIQSVLNALRHEGADAQLVSDPRTLESAEALVLPGVGAFGDCAQGLHSRNLWQPVAEWLAADRPFLGICVGYQLLFEGSEESPEAQGFGHFKGRVQKFKTPGIKVPQIGWNQLQIENPACPLWNQLPANPHVYFVHSFYPVPADPTVVTATACYGESFAAACGRSRVEGVQFHPEKSQAVGLRILRNFITTHSHAALPRN